MVYILIGFVLLMIIAPIVAILPSAGQKAQMARRKQAMAKNIRVDLTRIGDPDPDPDEYVTNTGRPIEKKCDVAAYRLPRARPKDWRKGASSDWAVDRINKSQNAEPAAGWRWDGQLSETISNDLNEYIVSKLGSLPNDVVRVEEKKFIVSVYWKEVGEVQEVVDFLTGCVKTSASPASTDDRFDDDLA